MGMDGFIDFAQHFAYDSKVRLDQQEIRRVFKLCSKPLYVIKTWEELIEFETRHKMYDLYIWLGQRFPEQFVDMELALKCATSMSTLVCEALKRLGPFMKERKREKKRIVNKIKYKYFEVEDKYNDPKDGIDDMDIVEYAKKSEGKYKRRNQ